MSFQQRLLPTAEADVPLQLRESLGDFCVGCAEVERGYICRVERRVGGLEPETGLHFAVKLTTPIDSPRYGGVESRAVVERFSRLHGDLVESLGLAVLADRAVSAWEARGVKVFDRSGPPQ